MASDCPPGWVLSLLLPLMRFLQAVAPDFFIWATDHIVYPLGRLVASRLSPVRLIRAPETGCPGVALAEWLWLAGTTVDQRTAILYLPGGAFLCRAPTAIPFAQGLLSLLAARGCAVPGVLVYNYNLPAHSAATVHEVEGVLRWLLSTGRRVVVAGDSAGACLAVQLALRAARATVISPTPQCTHEHMCSLAGAVGMYPWLDFTLSSPAHKRNAKRCSLHCRFLEKGRAQYFCKAAIEATSQASLFAEVGSAEELAALQHGAILLVRGVDDILADDGPLLAQRALDAGAPPAAISLVEVRGTHGAHDLLLWPMSRSAEGDLVFDAVASYIVEALHLQPAAM